jgi:TFIIH basal transcription factor complex TTD-A subunit
MSSSKSKTKAKPTTKQRVGNNNKNNNTSLSSFSSNGPPRSSGYLLTCDPPMRQFILHLNDTKIADKKFILENIDANHLLIKADARDEIARKVEEWMDMVRSSSLRT